MVEAKENRTAELSRELGLFPLHAKAPRRSSISWTIEVPLRIIISDQRSTLGETFEECFTNWQDLDTVWSIEHSRGNLAAVDVELSKMFSLQSKRAFDNYFCRFNTFDHRFGIDSQRAMFPDWLHDYSS